MAFYTFTAPETRSSVVPVSDVTQVRIKDLVNIDFVTKTVTFRYEKGRISGSVFIQEFASGNILAQGSDFDTIMGAAVDIAGTLADNIEAVLLQYLEDKGLIAAGTVTI
jgi:hypothetical protein